NLWGWTTSKQSRRKRTYGPGASAYGPVSAPLHPDAPARNRSPFRCGGPHRGTRAYADTCGPVQGSARIRERPRAVQLSHKGIYYGDQVSLCRGGGLALALIVRAAAWDFRHSPEFVGAIQPPRGRFQPVQQIVEIVGDQAFGVVRADDHNGVQPVAGRPPLVLLHMPGRQGRQIFAAFHPFVEMHDK